MARGRGNRSVHITRRARGWAVKRTGAQRASKVYRTQAQAERVGRLRARRTRAELVVHGRNGRIRKRSSFGHDPCPPRDAR